MAKNSVLIVMPKVSVIIPVYKTEATLPRCIDSVLAQTFTDLEIVLVDDGSPDRAGQICDEYAAQHSNIVVVHKQNEGLAEARRTGIHAASGRFFVPLDSDDTLPENAVELLYNHCIADNLDMCYGTFMRIVGDNQFLFQHDFTGVQNAHEFLLRNLTVGNNYGSCFCMTSSSVWHDDVFPPAGKRFPSEDVMVNIRLAKYLKRIGVYNDCVYNYYLNPDSLSISGVLSSQSLWADFFESIREYLRFEKCLDEEAEHKIRIMEIDRLAFYLKEIDKQDAWYRRVMAYDCSRYTIKIRVLHALLHSPSLLRCCVKLNRMRKRLF